MGSLKIGLICSFLTVLEGLSEEDQLALVLALSQAEAEAPVDEGPPAVEICAAH